MTAPERQQLRQWQKQRRDEAGYVQVTVILLLDKGRPLPTIADDLGLDEATVYRYVRAFGTLGVDQYLAHEQPGYWGLLTSAQLAHPCQQVNATLYTDSQHVRDWLLRCRALKSFSRTLPVRVVLLLFRAAHGSGSP